MTTPEQTASFRTYTIGIVTHGGIQNTSWKHGPPWELQIAYEMKREGYDAVIPYNWVAQSNHPGLGDQAIAETGADHSQCGQQISGLGSCQS